MGPSNHVSKARERLQTKSCCRASLPEYPSGKTNFPMNIFIGSYTKDAYKLEKCLHKMKDQTSTLIGAGNSHFHINTFMSFFLCLTDRQKCIL